MAELATLTRELVAFLRQMDDPEQRGSQPKQDTEGGHHKPGSKPPTSLEPVSWVMEIRAAAVKLDMALRPNSSWARPWDKAILDLPVIVTDAAYRDVHRQVARWHSTCRTVLGEQAPAQHMKHVKCLACSKNTVWYRAVENDAHAMCRNEKCHDEVTGGRAVYRGDRLMLLTTNRVAA